MEQAATMDIRDMLDETARMLSEYETERGTKQSFGYEVKDLWTVLVLFQLFVHIYTLYRCVISTRNCSLIQDYIVRTLMIPQDL